MSRNNDKTSRRNYRGRKTPKGEERKDCGRKDDLRDAMGKNDPQWYGKYPELLRDSASIPFSWSTGTLVDLATSIPNPQGHIQVSGYYVPGVQSLVLMPTIGPASDPTDPANIAATSVFSSVRRANAGSTNYDTPDLMQYLLAVANIYSAITWLERIYSEATLFSQRNRYLPRALMAAEAVDYTSVIQNLADFRYGINVLINKAASLSVPNDMPVFNRYAFLYQNIYTEGDSVKDQLYMYVPGGFHQFVIPAGGGPGKLALVSTEIYGNAYANSALPGNTYTYQRLLSFVDSLIAPIISSQDMNIMSGDILKAYGPEGCIKLIALDELRPIAPIFNIGVLEQMKNATIIPMFDESTLDIEQNVATNCLVCKNQVVIPPNEAGYQAYKTFSALNTNRLLTTTTKDVTPELTIESTRLMCAPIEQASYISEDQTTRAQITSGTEICVACTWWGMSTLTGDLAQTTIISPVLQLFNVGGTAQGFNVTKALTMIDPITRMSNFRFHPIVYPQVWDGGAAVTEQVTRQPIYDLDNYAILTHDDLRRMHEAALLSEYNVPIANRI